MSLEKTVTHFLKTHYQNGRPVLLALSGGPDSLALFYLLLKYRESHSLKLAVAHVDHRWRQESTEEALKLQKEVEKQNIPFHLHQLDPTLIQGNLEDGCRNARVSFFKKLVQEQGYQAVIMGHHADDQAETVLKRVCEGANLSHLCGLKMISNQESLTIWRPLLNIPKQAIGDWLKEIGIEAIQDSTNFDRKFLRGRLRTGLMDQLSKTFGKEVAKNLCLLSNQVEEYQKYVQKKLDPFLNDLTESPWGNYIDLSSVDLPSLELRNLILQLCLREKATPSREQVNLLLDLFFSGMANKRVKVKHCEIIVDRRRIFILQRELNSNWKLEKSDGDEVKTGWKHVWKGNVSVQLPEGDYYLDYPKLIEPYPGSNSSISKWWTNEKVPAFMRSCVPAIYCNGKIVHEFLSGRVTDKTKGPKKTLLRLIAFDRIL